MIQTPDVFYAPDLDTSWNRNPGILAGMSGFAPSQLGQYVSMTIGTPSMDSALRSGALDSYIFRKVDGTARFLVANNTRIDEYTGSGTETNRGTGYSESAGWSMAAWGDRIIACNLVNATQTSTGAGFSALGGDAPKAKFVAASLRFVLLAGLEGARSTVAWCDLFDPTSWTTGTTRAAGTQPLHIGGDITGFAAFRDRYIAFKSDAIYIGEEIGPPSWFRWRPISLRVGCSSHRSIVEMDNKLYWVHYTGVWEFDGANLRNIGLPVWQTVLNQMGIISQPNGSRGADVPSGSETASTLDTVRATADDIDGIVWFSAPTLSGGQQWSYSYPYNVRTQKWGRGGFLSTNFRGFVKATQSDMRAWKSSLDANARILYISDVTLQDLRYPAAWTSNLPAFVHTGLMGSVDGSWMASRVYVRALRGSATLPFASGTWRSFKNEQKTLGESTTALAANSTLDCYDVRKHERFGQVELNGENGDHCFLAGIGVSSGKEGR